MTSQPSSAFAPIGLISLAIIARNEQETLEGLLQDVVEQDYPHEKIELLLIDSASTDGTKTIFEEFAARERSFANIRVLDNPKKLIPQGWNIALKAYAGDVFIRVDAHARIPHDFVRRNVEVLASGEVACGGLRPTVLQEPTPWRETLLLAEESAFGSSPAAYRRARERGVVNSVFQGAYRREVFAAVGLYDERLLRTEDNDMSYRIRRAGFRIVLDPSIYSEQFVRSSLKGMLKQKEGNGYWIGRTLFIQPGAVSLFHLVPCAFVLAVFVGLILGLVVSWLPLLILALLYILANLGISSLAIIQARKRNSTMLALPLVFLSIHVAYGIGTVCGLITGLFARKESDG